jgi:mono/diheme cytochrome c family protein
MAGKIIVHALAYILLFNVAPHRSSLANEPLVAAKSNAGREAKFVAEIRPLLVKYCLHCHSSKKMEGELDLERFTSLALVRKDVKPWQAMIQQLETGEMPPKAKPQPTAAQRKLLIDWTRGLLDDEARTRDGDPGRVPFRRISNTEYNNTIRDLTGVDLKPTSDFPADGAAGEGFTNAAEALSMSPALMSKYVNAAKDVASHAVLLPNGFRFSPNKTRRDWTDESLKELRQFYWQFSRDGTLPLQPYVSALVRHREELLSGKTNLETVAANEKLSQKYLTILWQALTSKEPSYPLDQVRDHWQNAAEDDIGAIVAEVSAWRDSLWTFGRIGSYVNTVRQSPKDPAVVETQSIKLKIVPTPGQDEVVLYLIARELGAASDGHVVWHRPRFEGNDLPTLLLRDYDQFGPRFKIDYSALFADTEKYLAAAVEAANNPKPPLKDLAEKHRLNEAWLKRWVAVLDVKPLSDKPQLAEEPGRVVPAVAWELLDGTTTNTQRPAIKGWRPKGADLPIFVSNASDKTENVPGRISPHKVTVHPTPTEFVAVAWKSPFKGEVRVAAKVADAHGSCGNGFAWWLEKQTLTRSAIVAEGTVDLGKEIVVAPRQLTVSMGDFVVLAIDARDGNHSCDLTEIEFTVTGIGNEKGRVWDLAADVADDVLAGNPHADRLGNKDVWRFVKGSSKARPVGSAAAVDTNSLLTRWRKAAANPAQRADAAEFAKQIQKLLTGTRPADEHRDRALYDSLVSLDGALLRSIDVASLVKSPKETQLGLSKALFGKHPLGGPAEESSLVLPLNKVTEFRLPAELFRDRQFVVDGKLDSVSDQRAVQFQVLTKPPQPKTQWDAQTPVVAIPGGLAHKQFLAGLAKFRRLFPPNICYPHVIPLDEVVCLKTFHREDEPLLRLFLDDEQTQELERLWHEHRFITKYPVVENEYLPLFIGFVTQDQAKSLVKFFEDKRPEFQKTADDFERDFEAAAPQQTEQLLAFASRAYRRPLSHAEAIGLKTLYQSLRKKDVSHEEAFRSVLARVFMSPSFLLRLEQSPPGKLARPVNDWELASRLSYFLWASMPDDELRQLAAEGRLHEPKVLAEQTTRMLKDNRVRALSIEFGTQWIHVRGFDELQEKNEKLFPTFDEKLREAIYEESILFFQDLFQNKGSVTQILDADHTFLNETLAKHYGIPGVVGEQWRRVDGVKKYGRGGVLGLASVQAKQAGASRTSPILRGNWVVETLLGEKLPRPPPNVPQLPEQETGNDGLSMRQVVEKHVSAAECAVCHQRIDPFGFALEKYDPIGRLREKDLGGLPLDSRAKHRDGSEFEGIEGLRNYLLTQKKDDIARLFCRRLLGYALGRSVSLSDQILLDKLTAETEKDGGVSNAVMAIVLSKQFQMIRGSEYSDE